MSATAGARCVDALARRRGAHLLVVGDLTVGQRLVLEDRAEHDRAGWNASLHRDPGRRVSDVSRDPRRRAYRAPRSRAPRVVPEFEDQGALGVRPQITQIDAVA